LPPPKPTLAGALARVFRNAQQFRSKSGTGPQPVDVGIEERRTLHEHGHNDD
jgi:hypothetical protein